MSDEAERVENKRKINAIRAKFANTGVLEIFDELIRIHPSWKLKYDHHDTGHSYSDEVFLVTGQDWADYGYNESYLDDIGIRAQIVVKTIPYYNVREGLLIESRKVGVDGTLDDLISLSLP